MKRGTFLSKTGRIALEAAAIILSLSAFLALIFLVRGNG